jgi:hypothetical protein
MDLKHWNDWSEEDRGAVVEGCMTFYDPDADVGLNSVALVPGTCVPRTGERVWLPGGNRETADSYEVTEVRYLYALVGPSESRPEAQQLGIQIRVRRLS